MPDLPTTMRALRIHEYRTGSVSVTLEQIPTPQPAPGELLVAILASPINPSDLMFMQGLYGVRKPLPVVPGFEAVGRVVAVGDGLPAERWLGRRVACFAGGGDGTWAQYMTTSPALCWPVEEGVTDDAAATMLVNPLTAWALIDRARQAGIPAIVQTAAGSALGRMIERLAAEYGIAVINVVRRSAQADELRAGGSAHVLDSSADDFERQLRALCRDRDARIAFDAVGGALTGVLLRALPNGGRVTVYGGLALEPCVVPVDQLIFRDKSVDGFWLSIWMRDVRPAERQAAWAAVQSMIDGPLRTDIRARVPLEDAAAALAEYQAQMSGGKVLLLPQG